MREYFLKWPVLFLLFLVLSSHFTIGQIPGPMPDITEAMSSAYPALKNSSTFKKIPAELEKQILYALSYFIFPA
jgi:hypothetical protein